MGGVHCDVQARKNFQVERLAIAEKVPPFLELLKEINQSHWIATGPCLRPCKVFGLGRTKMLHVKHFCEVLAPRASRPSLDCKAHTKRAPQGALPDSSPARSLRPGLLALELFLRLKVLAGLLIDETHRQAHLAAVVKAQKLHFDLVPLLDDVGGFCHPALGKM
jgi:hypothetical protein